METDVQASTVSSPAETTPESSNPAPTTPPPSYVKLAMRNMVRKRGKSLKHFVLTTIALVSVFVGLAYLTR
ncbi:DUF3285 domain-containing protein [Pantanalinema rosaneae CENA516]|uniref:DUF3285 domain-containing protein n=1 Tax=Pantanalinema rosaneae TaxID=1620701 RepID=UPI003D6DD16A